VFWEEMPTQGELADFYADDYARLHGQLESQENHRWYYKKHVEVIARAYGRPARTIALLDFGSSFPVLVQEAIRAGMRAVALDDSADVHRWSREQRIPCLGLSQIDEVSDESLDVLRLSHVLEHLVDPKSTLEALLKKVKVGGLVYISQPNFPVFRPQTCEVRLKDSVWPTHLHFFSPASLTRLTDQMGLNAFRFDTHPSPPSYQRDQLMAALDPDCRRLVARLKWVRTRSFGECGFPWYLGENSECWARKATSNQPGNRSDTGSYPGPSRARLELSLVAIANLKARIAWMLQSR
jgi:SAM-dependent methyltransferase